MSFSAPNSLPDPNDLKGKKFIATVVDNNDPMKVERLKVTIPNLLVGPPDGLPWVARRGQGLIAGSKEKEGRFGLIPKIGVQVEVEFDDGDTHYGRWDCLPVQHGERPDEALVNYLTRYGLKDPGGNLLFIDIAPEGIQFQWAMANSFTIQADSQGNVSCTTHGTWTQHSQGTMILKSDADVIIQGTNVRIN